MKVVIVDDEKSMLIILKKMFSNIPEVEIIGSFTNSQDALEFIKVHKTDMILPI